MLKTLKNKSFQMRIVDVEKQLKEKIVHLDNLYAQIKIHHDRAEYPKAFEVFKEVAAVQIEFNKLNELLDFYKTAERLNQGGILVEVVKRGNEQSLAMG